MRLPTFEQGKMVIPVMIDEGRMPKPEELPEEIRQLSTLNGPELRNEKWRTDCEQFWVQLEKIYNESIGKSNK